MSDEESDRTRDSNSTMQLDARDVDEIPDLPNFPDHEEFVKTQEMDSLRREAQRTNPRQPSLETTQRYDVPDDLLELATRSQELQVLPEVEEPTWREFVAVVDPRGRIVLPSRVQADLRGKKLRVKYYVEGGSND